MMIHIDTCTKKNCWNFYDSYGEICVHCDSCSSDKLTRYTSRINCLKDWILEKENFDMWDDNPEWRKRQEKNIKNDIKHWKRQLRYYENKLKEL